MVLRLLVISVPIGILLGAIASGGVLRGVEPKMWSQLPLPLKFLYLSKRERDEVQPSAFSHHELLMTGFAAVVLLVFILIIADLDTTIRYKIFLQFAFVLFMVVSYFVAMFGIKWWVLNKWYPAQKLKSDHARFQPPGQSGDEIDLD